MVILLVDLEGGLVGLEAGLELELEGPAREGGLGFEVVGGLGLGL